MLLQSHAEPHYIMKLFCLLHIICTIMGMTLSQQQSNWDFATQLFSVMCSDESRKGENILVSPLSIIESLALIKDGATAKSRNRLQMTKLLDPSVVEAAHSLHKQSLGGRAAQKNGVEISIATSLWADSVKQSYSHIAKSVHFADTFPLQRQNLFATINKWVAKSTKGIIKTLFDPYAPVDPNMVAVLVNAVYFKGKWRHTFDPNKTVDGVFTTAGSKEMPAKYMTAFSNMKAIEHCEELGNASVLALDYGDIKDGEIAEFFAMFMLPADSSDVAMSNLVSGLQSQPLSDVLRKTSMRYKVTLQLPRFKLENGPSSLVGSLLKLGMVDAFDSSKSELFNEMTNDPLTYLHDIVHSAAIEVTEEGTVAAAATGAVMMTRSLSLDPSIELAFNRPFVVSIIHGPSGLPLFLGRVENPELIFESGGTNDVKTDEL